MAGNQASGLSRFVAKTETHQPTQNMLSRTRIAAQHKVPTNNRELQQAKLHPQMPYDNIPTPIYATKDELRDNFISEDPDFDQREQPQSPSPRDGFDDGNTLDSAEFDSTVTVNNPSDECRQGNWSSDDEPGSSYLEEYDAGNREHIRDEEEQIQQGQQYQRNDNYQEPIYPVALQLARRHSPFPAMADDRTHGKATHGSRFQKPTPHEHAPLVSRPIHNEKVGYQVDVSKKRGRVQDNGLRQEYDEQIFPKLESQHDRRQQEQQTHPSGQNRNSNPQGQEETASDGEPDEDYDDDQLRKMSFQDLQNEAFEHDPRALVSSNDQRSSSHGQLTSKPRSESNVQLEPTDLAGRWKRIMEGTAEEQLAYYSKLSTSEWEETGDLFIDRFSDLMKRIRAARTSRRAIIAAGELEIAQREDMIKGKSASFDNELKGMKRDGESVLRGKLRCPSPRKTARKA